MSRNSLNGGQSIRDRDGVTSRSMLSTAAACLMAMGLSACGYEAGGSAIDAALSAPTAPTAQVTESSVRSPSEVEDQVTAAVKASTPAPAPTAGSWIDTLVNDMKWFHDGPTAVLEAIPAWGSGASWPEATARPSGLIMSTSNRRSS